MRLSFSRPSLFLFFLAPLAIGAIVFGLDEHFSAPASRAMHMGAAGYEREQALSNMAAHGFSPVTDLVKLEDGSWRAEVQKDQERWAVSLSPQGSVRAAPLKLPDARAQLHIQLQ